MIENFLVPNSHVFAMNVPKEVHISHSSVIYLKSWFQNFCSELNVRITKCYMHQTFYDGENHVSNDLKMKRQIRHFPIIVEIKKSFPEEDRLYRFFINPTDRSRNSKKFGLEYKSEGKKHFIEKSTQIWCANQHYVVCCLLISLRANCIQLVTSVAESYVDCFLRLICYPSISFRRHFEISVWRKAVNFQN